jgi:hypothetical protein
MRRLVHKPVALASTRALPLRGSGCRNLALPAVYEQALHFPRLLHDLLFAEHN